MSNAITHWDLPIEGMTCSSCAGRVERALAKVPGVSRVNVNLASEQARIEGSTADLPGLIAAVTTAGYAGPSRRLELAIEGMTCASCAGRVERALAKVPGVLQASVNLSSERAQVQLLGTLEPATLIAAVAAAGYQARLQEQATADLTAPRLRRGRRPPLPAPA